MKHKVVLTFNIDPTLQSSTDTAPAAIEIITALLSKTLGIDEIEIECEGVKRTMRKRVTIELR